MGLLDALFKPPRPQPTASPPPTATEPHDPQIVPAAVFPSDTTRIVVLLDGDADYVSILSSRSSPLDPLPKREDTDPRQKFDATYLTVTDGGRNAALVLHKHVLAWNLERGGSDADLQVLVQLCWNQKGLEGHLRSQGIPANLSAFATSFNSSPFAFSIIDTGSGKEAADKSLQNLLRFHISQCDALVLGGAHDRGYADILHQLTPRLRQKVTLLRSGLITPHTAALMLPVITFPGMFFSSTKSTVTLARIALATDDIPTVTSTIVHEVQTRSVPHGEAATPTMIVAVVATSDSESESCFRPSTYYTSSDDELLVESFTQVNVNGFNFDPLVDVLLALRRAGDLQPRRSLVGIHLNQHKCKFTYSKAYASAAQDAGIVVLGGTSSYAWMELVGPSPRPGTTVHVGKFGPLLAAIREQQSLGYKRPLRNAVGAILKRQHPYLTSSFKTYTAEALEAGLILMGPGNMLGREWIRINSNSFSPH